MLNENSTLYTKAAGDYSRRRKRAQKMSTYLLDQYSYNVPNTTPNESAYNLCGMIGGELQASRSSVSPPSTSSFTRRKFSSCFTIDNLLADTNSHQKKDSQSSQVSRTGLVNCSPTYVPMYGVIDYYNSCY